MIAILIAFALHASAFARETIYDTHTGKYFDLQDIHPTAGEIYVLGEDHAVTANASDPETKIHHDNQVRWIKQMQSMAPVTVGMEFLTYTIQAVVDQFVAGLIPEADFLQQSGWSSGNPFEFYRAQILNGHRTIALNIPALIASHVAKNGPQSLDAVERAQLPPVWVRGNDAYFERFSEVMKDHVPAQALENYFWAQSLWDDTMAWKTLENARADEIFVIIVGSFHVEYGGGLPYELREQGGNVKTVLQVALDDWSQLAEAVAEDPKYGAAADYIWVHGPDALSE